MATFSIRIRDGNVNYITGNVPREAFSKSPICTEIRVFAAHNAPNPLIGLEISPNIFHPFHTPQFLRHVFLTMHCIMATPPMIMTMIEIIGDVQCSASPKSVRLLLQLDSDCFHWWPLILRWRRKRGGDFMMTLHVENNSLTYIRRNESECHRHNMSK